MPDNVAEVQWLVIDRLKLTKADPANVKLEVLYHICILINAQPSVFEKDITLVLPGNLQTDINNLWDDVRERLLTFLDLDME